jgi:hypothetical protein
MIMPNPDQPEHDRLPPDVRAAIDASMERYRLQYPDQPARSGSGLGAVLAALVIAVLASALLVLAALFVSTMDEEPAAPPIMVSTTPTPCPGPSGGVRCR